MRTAVLLMAHGTPASLTEMPEYLKVVRGGRPPSPELIEEMTHNYNAIGGRSPLTDITFAQADALAKRLGAKVPVVVGMRNWHPYIKEAMNQLSTKNVDRVIGLPLAPQFSTLSVQKYMDAASAALPASAIFEPVRTFHAHPLLLQAFAERLRDAAPRPDETVVFTAHSLPTRVIDGGDVYASEVAATAKGVAALAGIERYDIAYQSAGRTPEPWIGPDLSELVAARAAEGQRAFLVVPVGFVCDHTEILFDIDVQAAKAARDAGATLRRTESLNTSPTFIAALEAIVRALV
jgi:protoporphyrin/coproporphyrin ferrochelatase